MMMLQFAYSQWAFELPLQLKALFGEAKGPGIYGVLASFNGLLVIVLTPLVTPLIRRLKALWATLAGGLLYAISFGMLIFVRALPMFYVSMFIMTFGEVIMTIDSSVFIAGMLPSSHRGRIDSIVNSIMGMGRVFSPMVIGWIIAAGSLGAGWMAVSGAAFVGCIGLFVLIRSKTGRKQIDIVSEQSISG
jgi:MFS family permease